MSTLRPRAFSLRACIEEAARRVLVQHRGAVISLACSAGLPDFVVGEEHDLGRVLRKLLAIARAPAQLAAHTEERTGDEVRVAIGIAPIASSRSLGIGIAALLVARMGGRFSIQDDVVRITLALTVAPPDHIPETGITEPSPLTSLARALDNAGIPRLRILIAGPQDLRHKVIARYLEKQGHEIESAFGDVQALRSATSKTYHVIVVDSELPQAGEFIRRLRLLEGEERRTPVLFLGAGIHAASADLLLDKPVAMDDLTHAIGVLAGLIPPS